MNLTKLFEAQQVLEQRIEQEHPRQQDENRLKDKCLALLVELGECANEQRTWKFWSNDQAPRTHTTRTVSNGYRLISKPYNPLLEEYIDVLHFALSIGNEINFIQNVRKPIETEYYLGKFSVNWDAADTFGYLFHTITKFMSTCDKPEEVKLEYLFLLKNTFGLGRWLGFTWEEIESAYYEKNKINHQRQEEGY